MNAMNGIQALLTAALIGAAGSAGATSPIAMSYTLTGETGNWTLDFDVSNDMLDSDQTVFFIGVAVDGGTVASSPATFDSTVFSTWDSNFAFGGSTLSYNAVWISNGHLVSPGTNLDGFLVHTASIDAPTSANWFAFTSGSEYTGGGHFNTSYNPGWEGVATEQQASVVPEPANVALLLAGLGLVGFAARRRALSR